MGSQSTEDFVVLGRISAPYGVKGWVKVVSFTDPKDNILRYQPWRLKGPKGWESWVLTQGRVHGKGLVAKLEGCDDRDQAALLGKRDIAVPRAQLPQPEEGAYYWADLQGLQVVNHEGVDFGRVECLFETGANDVLVVKGERERLIPFLREQVILEVDLAQGFLRVNWDADF